MNIKVGNLVLDREYGAGLITDLDKNDQNVTVEWPEYKTEMKLNQLEFLLKFDRIQLIGE